MWSTAVCVAVLSLAPSQAGRLALTNVRPTLGFLGAPRTDNKVLPGDVYYLAFDIDGLTVDANGKGRYSLALDVTDPSGKSIFKQDPITKEAVSAFGGSHVPESIRLNVGLEQAPGEYTVKVTIADLANRASQTLSQKVQVQRREFGLVHLSLTGDLEGQVPVPPVGVPGQVVQVRVLAVGFARGSNKQPNVTAELRVVDATGKPAMAKPFSGTIHENIPENAPVLLVPFTLPLTRAGKFAIEVKATDHVSKKTATVTFPLTVVEAK
jgi:hypothetical protein